MKFQQEVPCKTLIEIMKMENSYNTEQPNSSNIRERIDSTYAHTTKTIQQLEDLGLITREPTGRQKIISLTTDGQELAEKIQATRTKIQEVTPA